MNPIIPGVEDTFYYEISGDCVRCGACRKNCPAGAIEPGPEGLRIRREKCIDCGTCSAVCPVGAARRVAGARESIDLQTVDPALCYFNPGCALRLYKPDVPPAMLALLREHFGPVQLHSTCCRHDPGLPAGATIINNCAGCDRRFRSLYPGIQTISFWEVIDRLPGLPLPDYGGLQVSVHDSCGYRHKPQVHRAVRSLLEKMNCQVVEAKFHGTESICCGDNYYGYVPDDQVEARIRFRADQFPREDVVVYCIGCVRAMAAGGKRPRYLPDLLLGRPTESMPDTLGEYHRRLAEFIAAN